MKTPRTKSMTKELMTSRIHELNPDLKAYNIAETLDLLEEVIFESLIEDKTVKYGSLITFVPEWKDGRKYYDGLGKLRGEKGNPIKELPRHKHIKLRKGSKLRALEKASRN